METTTLKAKVCKVGPYYIGVVDCIIDGKRIWSERFDCERLTEASAMRDALWLRKDIAEYNCMVEAKQ